MPLSVNPCIFVQLLIKPCCLLTDDDDDSSGCSTSTITPPPSGLGALRVHSVSSLITRVLAVFWSTCRSHWIKSSSIQPPVTTLSIGHLAMCPQLDLKLKWNNFDSSMMLEYNWIYLCLMFILFHPRLNGHWVCGRHCKCWLFFLCFHVM